MKRRQRQGWIIIIVAVVLGVGILSRGVWMSALDGGGGFSRAEICDAAKDAVRQELVAPATAQFEPCDEMLIITPRRYTEDGMVQGYVDAQNRLGALIRAEFYGTVAITYQGRLRVTIDSIE